MLRALVVFSVFCLITSCDSSSSDEGAGGQAGVIGGAGGASGAGGTGGASGAGGVGGVGAIGGAGGEATGGTGGAPAVDRTEQTLTTSGGVLEIPGFRLFIPPGALEAETTITLSATAPDASVPAQATLASRVATIEPSTLTFTLLPELFVSLEGQPADGQISTVARLEQGAFADLDSRRAERIVSASLARFGVFAARWVELPASSCTFTRCGGDPHGSWDFLAPCARTPPGPYPGCADATLSVDQTWDGSLALREDGTYEVSAVATTLATVEAPASCYEGKTTCNALVDFSGALNWTCTGDPASSCRCTQQQVGQVGDQGTFTAQDGVLTLTRQNDEKSTYEFCVDPTGDALELANPSVVHFLQRKP